MLEIEAETEVEGHYSRGEGENSAAIARQVSRQIVRTDGIGTSVTCALDS